MHLQKTSQAQQNSFMGGGPGYGGHDQTSLGARRSIVSTRVPFRSTHFRTGDDQFDNFQPEDQMNTTSLTGHAVHPSHYKPIPLYDSKSARFPRGYPQQTPQYPGQADGSRDSLVGSHGPIYSQGRSRDPRGGFGSYRNLEHLGGHANIYRPTGATGDFSTNSAGPKGQGVPYNYHGAPAGGANIPSGGSFNRNPQRNMQSMYGHGGSFICDTPKKIEARNRIVEALQLNKEFKSAVKQRVGSDAMRAIEAVDRAYKSTLSKRAIRHQRKQGYFNATLYLETRDHEEQPQPQWRVEVFGEFTNPPWSEKIPCKWDQRMRCFKVDTTIRVGDQFKFVIDNGRKYTVSSRYPLNRDCGGNENNKYQPKEVRWNRNERKSQKPHARTRSVYAVNKRMPSSQTQPISRRLTPKVGPSMGADGTFRRNDLPNYVGFDDLKPVTEPRGGPTNGAGIGHHPSAQDFERNYRFAYSPARTSPQRFNLNKQPGEINDGSPRIVDSHQISAPQQAFVLTQRANLPQHMQVQMGASAKHDGSERGNAYHGEVNPWLVPKSNASTSYEQNPEITKQFQDFRDQFESYFRGEPYYTKPSDSSKYASGAGQWPQSTSGFESIKYAYHSDDEYVENLNISGNYMPSAVDSFKKIGAASTTDFQDRYSQASMSVMDPDFTKELSFQKQFENIFDLIDDQSTGDSAGQDQTIGIQNCGSQFYMLSYESMHKKSLQETSLRSSKKKPLPSPQQPSNLVSANSSSKKPAQTKQSQPKTPLKSNNLNTSKPTQNSSSKKGSPNATTVTAPAAQKVQDATMSPIPPARTPSPNISTQGVRVSQHLGKQKTPPNTKETIAQGPAQVTTQIKSSSQIQTAKFEGDSQQAESKVYDIQQMSNPQIHATNQAEPASQLTVAGPTSSSSAPVNNTSKSIAQINQAAPSMNLNQPLSTVLDPRIPNKNTFDSDQNPKSTTAEQLTSSVPANFNSFSPADLSNQQPNSVAATSKEAGSVLTANPLAVGNTNTNRSKDVSGQVADENKQPFASTAPVDIVNNPADKSPGAAKSEISFFYEEPDVDTGEDDAEKSDAPFILLQGACRIGKAINQCEDAYFLLDRAFGVSDGVSGWNDYGFSSDQFSLQLMMYAKQMLEKYITSKRKESKTSKMSKSVTGGGGIKRNRSLLSMDNLDIDEDDNSDNSDEAASANNSHGSDSLSSNDQNGGADNSRDSSRQQASKQRGNFTERTARVQSLPDGGTKVDDLTKPMTLEEEVAQKLSVAKISQDDINEWVPVGKDGQPSRSPQRDILTINSKRYEADIFPTYILQKAFAKVNAVGSATAMIAILNKQELSVANIGDSGFLVIRFKQGEPFVPRRSKEQQHAFNIPYQLSQLPTKADLDILRQQGKRDELARLRKVLKKKNQVCQDQPDSADDYTIDLKDGDIIMSATDGVFDNLFQHEILGIIKEFRENLATKQITSDSEAETLSKILADAAVQKFKDPQGKKTPYQRKYKKTYNCTWEGGKEDDVTVLISVARRIKVTTSNIK